MIEEILKTHVTSTKNMADFFNVCKHSVKQGATSRWWLKMYMLYKADQHTAYGDSQYSAVYLDASSQGW